MKITTVGIDLAKTVFQVHGADARGKVVLRKQLRRDQVTAFFANLEPCLIGLDYIHHQRAVSSTPPVAQAITTLMAR